MFDGIDSLIDRRWRIKEDRVGILILWRPDRQESDEIAKRLSFVISSHTTLV